MRRLLSASVLAFVTALFLPACDYDNFDPPNTTLEGAVIYNGEQVGVSHGIYGLQLWEPGYELNDDIQVFLQQDGTFSSKVFDGEYKLVRRPGGGPWVPNTDSVRIQVDGSNVRVNQGNGQVSNGRLEVPVQPYFWIENENIERNQSTITASFEVSQEVASADLETVGLYVGSSRLVDESGSGSDAVTTMSAGEIEDRSSIQLSVDVSDLGNTGTLYARIGVKAAESEQLLYTPVVEF
jgi:hypothetical protein